MKTILRRHLQQTYSEKELRQWFEPLRIIQNDIDKSIQVVFPHPYFAQWFCDTVQQGFEEQLALHFGPGCAVTYSCRQQGAVSLPMVRQRALQAPISPFGGQFTFDSFIFNQKNQFPWASAREIGTQKEVRFNPLVICGPRGCGKTHLLKAIGNEFSRSFERASIFFGTLEEMASIYATSFNNDLLRARKYFLPFDCLLMDDVQRISEHEQLQEELVILFDQFHDSGKQMVFCCSGKLGDVENLSEALRSRLEWGLIITLKEPDLDIRVKYVQSMCKTRRIKLSKEQVLILAQRFTDLRYLEGILLKLFAFKKLVHKNIQESHFQQILSHAEGKTRHGPTPEEIIGVVAEHFALPPKTLTGNKRERSITFARQVAMYLCRQLTGCSYPALGRHFGGKDHSTAMYAVDKINKLQTDNQDLQRLLTTLKKKCSQVHGQ